MKLQHLFLLTWQGPSSSAFTSYQSHYAQSHAPPQKPLPEPFPAAFPIQRMQQPGMTKINKLLMKYEMSLSESSCVRKIFLQTFGYVYFNWVLSFYFTLHSLRTYTFFFTLWSYLDIERVQVDWQGV